MTDSEHNDDFEAYLRRRVPIDRRLALMSRLEPPVELDRIVIGQARLAIQGPAPVPVFRGPRWALPMGLAATILVSLSLLLDVGMRGAMRKDAVSQLPVMAAASQAASEEVATRIVEGQLPPGVVSETAVAAEPAAAASAGAMPAPASALAPTPTPAALTPPHAAVASASKSQPTTFARSASRTTASPIRPAPVTNDATEQVARDDGRIRLAAGRSLATGRMRAAEGTSGSAVPTPIAFPMDPMETVTITGTRIRTQSVVVTAAPTIFPEQPARAAVGSAAERHKHPDPRAWLDYIEKMRAQGLTSEAEQEFKHFRDVYPGYSVPPEAAPADGRPQ